MCVSVRPRARLAASLAAATVINPGTMITESLIKLRAGNVARHSRESTAKERAKS